MTASIIFEKSWNEITGSYNWMVPKATASAKALKSCCMQGRQRGQCFRSIVRDRGMVRDRLEKARGRSPMAFQTKVQTWEAVGNHT